MIGNKFIFRPKKLTWEHNTGVNTVCSLGEVPYFIGQEWPVEVKHVAKFQ
jgi:hypothetical protein